MQPSHSLIEKLSERGFAGSNVAASPSHSDDPFWPGGARPDGVDELIELILDRVQKRSKAPSESHWVFLLGGAGNGKSYAARSLLDRLRASSPSRSRSSSRPKRKYTFKGKDCTVSVINDATIATEQEYEDDVRVALAQDLAISASHARKSRAFLFACVNRGVVLEELHALHRLDRKALRFSAKVLEWLDGGEVHTGPLGDDVAWATIVEQPRQDGRYRSIRVKIGEAAFLVLHALAVDVGSLFEPRLSALSLLRSAPDAADDVAVAMQFRQSADARLASPAGALAANMLNSDVATQFRNRPEQCPLRANFASLASSGARASWLTALRGAEVASNRQITYRDFWGLFVLSLIGPRTVGQVQGKSSGSVIAHVDEQLLAADAAESSSDRLAILARLATRRLHVALFRGHALELARDNRLDSPPEFPACRGLTMIDPALDVTEFSAEVERAMEHLSLGKPPSEYLLAKVPALREGWHAFDTAVEAAVMAFLRDDENADKQRREVQSWFGGYLQRAVGCYVGGLGHESVISAWYRCWHAAKNDSQQFPARILGGLRTLLLPALSFQSNLEELMTMPAFSSRASPCESREAADGELVVGLPIAHLRLSPSRKLDRLWIELRGREGIVVAQGPLDFLLLREALICSSGSIGFSEAGAETAPRLERARAAMISTGSRVSHYHGLVTGGYFKELGP